MKNFPFIPVEEGGGRLTGIPGKLSLRTVCADRFSQSKMRLLAAPCVCERGESRRATHKSAMMRLLFLLISSAVLSCHGCPDKCLCSSETVKCQNQDLKSIPHSLPTNTKFLFVTGNKISRIGEDSFPTPMERLTDLCLSGNELESVEAKVFDNLPNLARLDLSNNIINNFNESTFPHNNTLQVLNLSMSFHNFTFMDGALNSLLNGNLIQLTVLDLSNIDLWIPPDNMFSSLPSLVSLSLQNSSIISIQNGTLRVPPLRDLDLRDNSLRYLPPSAMAEFSLKPELHIRLAGNPWQCDCLIEETLVWLQNTTQVVDVQHLTCADPVSLRHQHVLQLQHSQLKCLGDKEGVLETSYVFLGLVLALIGVIFLLVIYLNRKGIKRWMYNIRDACRDHMEGYHYRYEMSSDPRLANLSINSDV